MEDITMNRKIEKVREDIRKTEARIHEQEAYLKTLQMQERQLCDEEITKTIRDMAGTGDVMETLRLLQEAQQVIDAGATSGREEMNRDA
jgi:hypothetical protein